MERDVEIFAVQSCIVSDITFDHFFLFRMDGDQHIRFTEDTFQALLLIHQHVACGRTEEQLQPRHTATVQLTDLVHIIIRSAEEERVVGGRCFRSALQLPFQIGYRGSLRLSIRHIHKRGDTASYGRTAFTSDVSFMCQARFTEMYLIVDCSR